MPYSSNDELPAHVRKLPEAKQRQWRHVFNSCAEDGGDDGKCMRMANGVTSKALFDETGDTWDIFEGIDIGSDDEIELAEKSYQYVDTYEYESRKMSQEDAGYNPVGGSNKEACSNCMFFVSPARCTVVSGEIAPNGHSNQWKGITPYEPAPLPVVIVGGGLFKDDTSNAKGGKPSTPGVITPFKELFERAYAALTGGSKQEKVKSDLLCMVKQADGRTRWFTRYSNAWEDRDGEIITEASHKAYTNWAEKQQFYPELWLWHTQGTRFGQADWLDFADGFAFASGLIDDTKEAQAVVEYLQKVQADGTELGVSHGFFSKQSGKYTTQHCTFEISVLPLDRAAVWTTDFNFVDKESEAMAFTDERRKFLTGALGEDRVKVFEQNTEKAVSQLKALGIEYKEVGEPADDATAAAPPAAELAEMNAKMNGVLGEVERISNILSATVNGLVAVKETAEKASKTLDESVADQMVSRLEKAMGVGTLRPTASDSNVMGDAAKAKASEGVTADVDPLLEIVRGSFGAGFGAAPAAGGVGTPAVAGVSVGAS